MNSLSIGGEMLAERNDNYETPSRILFLKNRIEVYQRQMDDLCNDRRKAIEELEKFSMKAKLNIQHLQNNLGSINYRLCEVERKLKAVHHDLKRETENL